MADTPEKSSFLPEVMDNLPVGVLQVDQDFNLAGMNATAQKLTGFSLDQARGEPCEEILRCDQCGPRCPLRRSRDLGIPSGPILGQAFNRNGEELTISLLSAALKDPAGRFLGGVEIIRDATESRTLAQENSLLMSMLVHDMKTPLVSVKGFTGYLLKNLEKIDPAKTREFLEMISQEAERLEGLINDFLKASREHTLEMGLNLAPLNPVRLLEKLLHDRAGLSQNAGVEIQIQAEDDVPKINGDAALLRRAFSNLLDNALRRSAPGSVVSLRLWHDKYLVHIQVIDPGTGISPQDLPRIFEPFYRGSGSTGHPGHGLGLAGVKAIVEAHGGGVTASMGPHGGNTFEVTLPLTD